MHTKGDWRVGDPFHGCGDEIPIYGEDHHELARVFIHNGEQFANARLIASAPRMAEALKDAQFWFAQVKAYISNHGATLGAINEALAKAEGIKL